MFEILITYLKELLESSKIVEKVTYAERKNKYSKDGKIENVVPMEPSGNAYLPINWDEFNGVIYIRENGRIRSSDSPAKAKACAREYQYSIPLKIVAGVTKDKACFLAHNLAEKIISVISGKNGALKDSLNAKSVIIKTQSYITDSEFIQGEEYKTNPRFGYDLTLVSLDILVEVYSSHNLSCFQPPCPEVSRPVEPEPECFFEIDFTSQEEAEGKQWVSNGWNYDTPGHIYSGGTANNTGIFGDLIPGLQNQEYTISVQLVGDITVEAPVNISIFGGEFFNVTAPGLYNWTVIVDPLQPFILSGTEPNNVGINYFKIC